MFRKFDGSRCEVDVLNQKQSSSSLTIFRQLLLQAQEKGLLPIEQLQTVIASNPTEKYAYFPIIYWESNHLPSKDLYQDNNIF